MANAGAMQDESAPVFILILVLMLLLLSIWIMIMSKRKSKKQSKRFETRGHRFTMWRSGPLG